MMKILGSNEQEERPVRITEDFYQKIQQGSKVVFKDGNIVEWRR
jgi:hypothetical protein